MPAARIVATLSLAALLAAGCGSDDGEIDTTADGGMATTTTEAETTTSTGDEPTTPSTTVPNTTTALPEFPPARTNLSHGGETWAVVLAGAADPGDQALTEAAADADAAGYRTGATDCDTDAAEALGMEPQGTYTVSVYFEGREQAEAAAEAFAARDVEATPAEIATYCMD